MKRTFVSALTVTILCGVVFAFYGCWFAISRLARGSEVASSLSVDSDKMQADVAQAKDKATELSNTGK